MVLMHESTEKPHTFLLHGSRQKDSVAACLCTAALVVRTGWSPVSLMTRARHIHALSSPSTVHSLESLAQVLLITGVDKTTGVVGYPIVEGIQPMVSRLRMLCLGLGLLSTVMACTTTPPPPVAPLRATLPPAAPSAVAPPASPPADLPPAVAPLPYVPPPSTTGTRRPDVYQPSPYERKMDEEERDYRRRRSAQEQEQEQRYQQWQQERARERDPRYEWMR
jgi:hypothetical protein